MRIENLFYAVEIADTGSFSQAARNLYVSQPNLSHAVRQLEERFGKRIFERSSSGVILTPEGRELIERFRIMKRQYDEVQEMLERPERETRRMLRVVTLNCNRVAGAFSVLLRRYADQPINFSMLNYSVLDKLLPEIEKGQADFAIIGTLTPYVKNVVNKLHNLGIEYHRLSREHISVVVGPSNPLFSRETVNAAELAPYSVIQYGSTEEDPSYSMVYEAGLYRIARGMVQVSSREQFYSAIRDTTVVGLASENSRKLREGNALHYLRLSDCTAEAEFAWIKLERMPMSPLAEELLQEMKAYF